MSEHDTDRPGARESSVTISSCCRRTWTICTRRTSLSGIGSNISTQIAETLRTRARHLESQLVALRNRKTQSHRQRSYRICFMGRIPLRKLRQRLRRAVQPSTTSAADPDRASVHHRCTVVRSPADSRSRFPDASPPQRPDLRVAAIMDPFSRAAFSVRVCLHTVPILRRWQSSLPINRTSCWSKARLRAMRAHGQTRSLASARHVLRSAD